MITTYHAQRTLLLLAALTSPAVSQVDPSGTWRTLHTQHFRIHFRPDYRGQALEAAAEAERAYGLLSSELRAPRGTIDLTLSDDVDTPNGFATTYPSNRFTILLVPPVTDPGLQVYDSWKRLVIVHELAHVFHLDRSRGLWGALQSVFGRAPGLFPNEYQPSWVIEGIATYYETRFTNGGRAEGSFHRQVVGADAAAGQARSPWDALLFTRWPNGLAPYAYGSRYWEYVSRTAGDSVIPRFMEGAAGQLIPVRVGRPLRRTGVDLGATWRTAVATAASTQPATRSRLIVGGLRNQPVARVSPDGRRLAYVHGDGRGAPRLRVIDPQSGGELRSHRVTGQASCDWLGDTLVVAQLDFTSRWRIRSDLWKWLPNGAWTRVTNDGRVIEPRAGGGVLSALRLSPGASTPTRPTESSESGVPVRDGVTWGPAVPSPDGRWIAAPRHQDGRWALVRWRTGASETTTVLAEAYDGSAIAEPVWTGDAILFVTDVAGFPQIHRWSERLGVTQLTAEPWGARAPAPLRDGRIVFSTLGDGGWELRAVEPSPLATAPAASADAPPAFTPAPPVTVRETGYAGQPSLRPHFWIPLIINANAAGTFVGALTAGVDAVGRDAYFAAALIAPSTGRVQGSAAFLTHRLGNPTIELFAASDWSQIGTRASRALLANELDAGLSATFLTRRWRRSASVRIAAEYEGERFAVTPDTIVTDLCAGCVPRDLIGGSVTLNVGSSIVAPLSVSLQDGASASLLYRRREEQGTARWLNELRARGHVYVRLGPRVGFAYPVLAMRGAFGALDGPIFERLSVGGVSSGGVALGLGQRIGTIRTFPVRGYASLLHGRRAATLSAEYRVPLALIGRSLGHLPFGADKLAFTVFGDVGDAWNPGEPAQLHRLRSVGAELVGDLTISYDFPLRVRVGVARPATGPAKVYAAFAADF